VSISIGSIQLAAPVLLAPMSGVTDLPFRRLVSRLGAGLVLSEMVASGEMCHQSRRSMRMIQHDSAGGPWAVQIAGRDPAVMAEAARMLEGLGADLIDINMGCPARKVVNGLCGSALMKEPELARQIIQSTVEAVSIPVTLKMRTGWDDSARNAPELARIAEDIGVKLITVHGRTRCQFYTGRADWSFISEVKKVVQVPVIANGDIVTVDDAAACLAASGADGVMIGRGTYGKPWFIGQTIRFLADGSRLAEPTMAERCAIIDEHYQGLIDHYGYDAGLRAARKHLGWYAADLPGGELFRQRVVRMDRADDVRRAIRSFFLDEVREAIAA